MSIAAAATPRKPIHGTMGAVSVTVSATETEFPVESFEFTHNVDTEDVTVSSSLGWRDKVVGVQDINGTLTFIYDLANKPLIAPYSLIPGTTAALKLYAAEHQTTGQPAVDAAQLWSGGAILKNFKFKSGPKAGACEVSCDFESTGTWTIPTA